MTVEVIFLHTHKLFKDELILLGHKILIIPTWISQYHSSMTSDHTICPTNTWPGP